MSLMFIKSDYYHLQCMWFCEKGIQKWTNTYFHDLILNKMYRGNNLHMYKSNVLLNYN